MIDVQHRALRALKQNRLTACQRAIQQFRGIADVAANFLAQLQRLFYFLGKVDVSAVRAFCQAVFLGHDVGGLFSKQLRLEQIAHPQTAPRHLIFVSRANAARGRADFVGSARRFRRFVQFAMIRKNQVRAVAHVQPAAHFDARFRQGLDFRDQGRRIHHYARANHRVALRTQNSARNELQHETIFSNDDRMPGVVAPGNARDIVERAGEIVDDFTLALIPPLRADHNDGLHSLPFSSHLPRSPGNSHGLSGPHSSPSTTS